MDRLGGPILIIAFINALLAFVLSTFYPEGMAESARWMKELLRRGELPEYRQWSRESLELP